MDELTGRIAAAKRDNGQLDKLISDYLPFMKKEITRSGGYGIEYDDCLSLAMLVFMNCVWQYEADKGGFLNYYSVALRNRLIDEGKKQARREKHIEIVRTQQDGSEMDWDADISADRYNREKERQGLAEEITLLTQELEPFGITYRELAKSAPKQKRSRALCMLAAQEIIEDPALKKTLFDTRRIAQSEVARRLGVSEKTVEKYRRYIVALAVIIAGEYPQIRAFIPDEKEVE